MRDGHRMVMVGSCSNSRFDQKEDDRGCSWHGSLDAGVPPLVPVESRVTKSCQLAQSVLDHRAAHSHAHPSLLLLISQKFQEVAMNNIYFSTVFPGL